MLTTLSLPAITEETIGSILAPGSGLVAIEFTADWCPPCRVMAPIVEAIAREFAPSLRVFVMDADISVATMARYGVRGLPTLLLFREGELVERIGGAMRIGTVRERLERHVG